MGLTGWRRVSRCRIRFVRRRLCGFGILDRGHVGYRSLPSQNLEHHRSAGGATTLDCPPAILHGLFDAIGDFLPRLTLNAIAFHHKQFGEPPRNDWSGLARFRTL